MAPRRFHGERAVRLSDTAPDGRLRLDAVSRYLQDVASDDAHDAGVGDATWVVRRVELDVFTLPRLHDRVALTTWCTGTGPRWAERTTSVEGGEASLVATALWVHVDPVTGAPAPLPQGFAEHYDDSAAGRRVGVRLTHGGPPTGATGTPWVVRAADLDVLAHVNNAVYWAIVEEVLQRSGRSPEGLHLELEFRGGLTLEPATVAEVGDGDRVHLWVLDAAGAVAASVRLRPLPR